MSDIITTLHPENDESVNLYPNIKKENIPNGVIDRNKLGSDVNSLLDSINDLHPSGVDTEAHILAKTSNQGIWIGSDTGKWYYWNGSQYVEGGTYLTSNIVSGRYASILVGRLDIDTTNLTITSSGIQYNTNDYNANIVLANQSISYSTNANPYFIYFDRQYNTIVAINSVTQGTDLSNAQNNSKMYLIAILFNGGLSFTLSSEHIYINNIVYTNILITNGINQNDNINTATHYPFVKYSQASTGKYQKAILNIVFTSYTTTNLSLHAIFRNAVAGSNVVYSVVLWNNDTNSQLSILNVLASGYTEKVRNTFTNVGGFSGYFDIDWNVIANGTSVNFVADRPKILPICFKDINSLYEEFTIPSTIPVVINREIRLEYYNMFKCDNINDYVIVQSVNGSAFQNLQTALKIMTTNAGDTNETIFFKKDNINLLAKTITIKSVNDATKPSIKAIFIGDSFTDAGYYLAELKTLMGENLTLYGTLTSNALNSNDESVSVNDEGRSGWSSSNYVNDESRNGVVNPFYNNGFDFSYYMTNNPAFNDVTDVFILLGPNDGNSSTFITNIQTMCNSIKEYNSNIKIHLMLPIPPIRSGYAWGVRNSINVITFKNYMFEHCKELINTFDGVSGYSVIATNLNIDCWYDFPKTEVQANMRNPELIEVGNDNVHPNRYGYYRLADMIYADIIANS